MLCNEYSNASFNRETKNNNNNKQTKKKKKKKKRKRTQKHGVQKTISNVNSAMQNCALGTYADSEGPDHPVH